MLSQLVREQKYVSFFSEDNEKETNPEQFWIVAVHPLHVDSAVTQRLQRT